MQRVKDLLVKDLNNILTLFQDFSEQISIRCNGFSGMVWGSLQVDRLEMSASESAINTFSTTLYMEDNHDEDLKKGVKKNAIIYVNDEAFRVIDVALAGNLYVLTLEKGTKRYA